jgi:hypothetical protein
MPMASGYADARSPPLRPAEATTTVTIEKAPAVIPSACVVLPAGAPGRQRRDGRRRTDRMQRQRRGEGRSWHGRPVRVARTGEGQPPGAPSGWPAGEPACSRPIGPLGVISAPRNSRGLPESRSRESRPTTRRPLEPHCRNGGLRNPPPSGSPSGPVGPSGRNSNPDFPVQPRRPLGATFNSRSPAGWPSRRRFGWPDAYVQLRTGRITSMEFR